MVALTTLPHERPMKRLYLLRHAKSSWKDATLGDHDRPLAGRGRRASKVIARRLRDRGIEPEVVLCSTARRARETLDRIAPALGAPAVEFEPDLYARLPALAGVSADQIDAPEPRPRRAFRRLNSATPA
jgi:phosphohistidine phosphatase SixA